MQKKRSLTGVAFLVCGFGFVSAQTLDLSGTVTNGTGGAPLANVKVSLVEQTGATTTTGTDGAYHLTSASATLPESNRSVEPSCGLHGKFLLINAEGNTPVSVELFTASGAKAATILSNKSLAKGYYSIDLSEQNLSSNTYFIRYNQGLESRTFRFVAMGKTAGSSGAVSSLSAASLTKRAASPIDTVVFTLSGYSTVQVPITSYTGTNINAVLSAVSQGPAPAGMRLISAGTFIMGSADSNAYYANPPHQVTISHSFYMDTTPVTELDWTTMFHGLNPSMSLGDTKPVNAVVFLDACLYCNLRSKRDGKDTVYSYSSCVGTPGKSTWQLPGLTLDYTKSGYRLPTEAEYEYAARAGTTTKYYWGDTLDADYCWAKCGSPEPVATKKPNNWGLYDMSGNVWEWCNDWWGGYPDSAVTDPTGPAAPDSFPPNIGDSNRVCRGGSWQLDDNLDFMPVAHRGFNGQNYNFLAGLGFRCVIRK